MPSYDKTPLSERVYITFVGNTNSGKSSLMNKFLGQDLSIVSEIKGTTTDPVHKTMELLPLGPVVLVDTPGIDDIGDIGKLRISKTFEALRKTDIAILVIDCTQGKSKYDDIIVNFLEKNKKDYVIVYNKSDLINNQDLNKNKNLFVSAKTGYNLDKLKDIITSFKKQNISNRHILKDLISINDIFILVTPIDESAPKGRLILPQQQVIREILDFHGMAIVTQETQLKQVLKNLHTPPKMVITDSQVFYKIKNQVPENILLTSFSILFARYKGDLNLYVQSVKKIESLKDNQKILIVENCSHKRLCNDIGSVQIPKLIQKYTNKKFEFFFKSGYDFPENLSEYDFVVHCGGCMINFNEMQYRNKQALNQKVPITNYGVLISYVNGILDRSIQPFKQ